MAVQYSGVECELREVVLKNKPASMLSASPKGTVPVLLDGDQVIDESIDIMSWALAKSDTDDWLIHALDHPLIKHNDGEFKFNLDRYKYFERYPEQSQSWYFNNALVFLHQLESLLVVDDEGQYFLESPAISALDIAIFPFIRQFSFVDKSKFDALALPKLQAWLAFFLDSPLFLNVMTKYPAWRPEQEECILFGTWIINIC